MVFIGEYHGSRWLWYVMVKECGDRSGWIWSRPQPVRPKPIHDGECQVNHPLLWPQNATRFRWWPEGATTPEHANLGSSDSWNIFPGSHRRSYELSFPSSNTYISYRIPHSLWYLPSGNWTKLLNMDHWVRWFRHTDDFPELCKRFTRVSMEFLPLWSSVDVF